LISQFFSLFSGLCLVVNSYIRKDLSHAGQIDTTGQSSAVFEALIIGGNLSICVLPIILFFNSEEFSEIWTVFSTKFKSIIGLQNSVISECESDELQNNSLLDIGDAQDSLQHSNSDMTQSNTVTVMLGWDHSSIQEVCPPHRLECKVTCSAEDLAWSVAAVPGTQAAEP
jgi:hypothetical protein